ncbi:hypothetical protein D3C86_1255090 [compost metagenome]
MQSITKAAGADFYRHRLDRPGQPVLDGVFDEGLQDQAGHHGGGRLRFDDKASAQAVGKSDLFDVEVAALTLKFGVQPHQFPGHRRQGVFHEG